MKVILCKIGQENIEIKHDYVIENIERVTSKFSKKIKGIKFNRFFCNEALDLYYISIFVFLADRLIKRDQFSDGWTRSIKLLIPVLEEEKWRSQKNNLEKILSYLSGDLWNVEFRKRDLHSFEEEIKNSVEKNEDPLLEFEDVAMFSGGLDSYVGAIDFLESKKKTLFISHYGGGKGARDYQEKLKGQLCNLYSITSKNFLQFYLVAKGGKENTTRTRSLMFFAHAILIASTLPKKGKVFIPENGLISLNIPMTSARLGSSSTRTTHPYYLKNLQILLNNLNIDVELVNPYQFKTKGEMILECKNIELLKETIVNTMSCSHPDQVRYKGSSRTEHCGYCLPCIIRRASIRKALKKDDTSYYDKNLKSGKVAMYNMTAYKFGLERFKENKLNPRFIIQKSGPLTENLSKFSDLYIRGMKELEELLESIDV